MVNLVPSISTIDRNQTAQHFKVVKTNINETLTVDLLSKARVILIGEAHDNKDDELGIVQILNSLNSLNIQLLLESNTHEYALSIYDGVLDKSLLKRAKSWDLSQVSQQYLELVSTKIAPLLMEGLNLLWASYVDLKGEDPQKKLPHYVNSACMWLDNFDKAMKLSDSLIKDNNTQRNLSLARNVKNALTTAEKVVAIAGSAHIVPSSESQATVDFGSEIENIPFVILSRKIFMEKEEIEIDSARDSLMYEKAAKQLEGCLFPSITTILLTVKIITLLDSETCTSSHLRAILNEIATHMYALKQCTKPIFANE